MNQRHMGKCNKQTERNRLTRAQVEVVILTCCLFFSVNGNASTSSGWTQQPSSWNNSDSVPSSSPHRSSHSKEFTNGDVSPFSPGSNNLALDLGQVFLMGDLTKYSNSLGTQLHYTYGVSELLAFDSSIGYSEHSDGQFSMTTLLTGIRLNMSWYDKVIPYAVFGLGFYRPSYQDMTGHPSPTAAPIAGASAPGTPNVTAVLFGLHLGPGVDLELSRNMFFGAAVTFHDMFGTTEAWSNGAPVSVGGTYTTFYMHVGATF